MPWLSAIASWGLYPQWTLWAFFSPYRACTMFTSCEVAKKKWPSQTVLHDILYHRNLTEIEFIYTRKTHQWYAQTFTNSNIIYIYHAVFQKNNRRLLHLSLVKDFFNKCMDPVSTITPSSTTSWGLMPRGSANLQRYLKSGIGQSCLLEADFNQLALECQRHIYIYNMHVFYTHFNVVDLALQRLVNHVRFLCIETLEPCKRGTLTGLFLPCLGAGCPRTGIGVIKDLIFVIQKLF